jgi:hypothetical protein
MSRLPLCLITACAALVATTALAEPMRERGAVATINSDTLTVRTMNGTEVPVMFTSIEMKQNPAGNRLADGGGGDGTGAGNKLADAGGGDGTGAGNKLADAGGGDGTGAGNKLADAGGGDGTGAGNKLADASGGDGGSDRWTVEHA